MKPSQQVAVIQCLVNEQLVKHAERIRRETAQQVFAVMLKNLHDKHGFTPEQLIQVFERTVNDFEAIGDKYVKIEDFYKLLEELGIKLK